MKQKNAQDKGLYPEFDGLNLAIIDQKIAGFWEKNKVFKQSMEPKDGKKPFVFYEGPPSANGMPGIHHVIGRTVKDIFCRYKTMQGYQVLRKGGWDTHGLPVELKVEKELGITKEDIGTKISVEDYNKECRKTVLQFKNVWDDLTKKMGYWVDLDNPYVTFDNDYIESVWWALGELYKKNLIYKGYTIQPFSPAAGTGLSTHELNQPGAYRDVTDTSAVAQFKVLANDDSKALFDDLVEDTYFIAWTTTPWTLPSNTALAVGGKIEYQLVKTFNPYTFKLVHLVLAKNLVAKWFKEDQENGDFEAYEEGSKAIPWKVVNSFTGKELEGVRYEQLLPFQQPEEGDAFRVILGDFVSTEDGTGIVHLAPSFGADDMRVAKAAGIGSLTLVDKQGKFIEGVGEFSGRYVKDYKEEENYRSVDIDISIKLKEENKAFNVQKYVHNYPHCWRTDKPILYYPLDSWFIQTTAVKEDLIKNNNLINWKPESTGKGRFGNWLENLQDWNLSRSRFWGIPLPIWRTEDGEEVICIGSVAQLKEEMLKADKALGIKNEDINDLHKPYIDRVTLVSPSGKPMKRESDVIDVWFDSGSMPFAQQHYPFENEKVFGDNFPADFIAEGVDQTRGWFFTLHAISTMLFNKPAYKNVIANGLVLDEKGQKMSKRVGNVVDPFTTLDKYGADATRWYIISNSQPWDNLKFSVTGIEEVRRKLFGTLYNTYSFFALYANIDGFAFKEEEIEVSKRQEIDQWILSVLNSLVKNVTAAYDDYEPTNAARLIQEFVDDNLSNWYVRLNRRRFWKGEYSEDKVMAYQTLYTCLDTLSKLMAPIAPFFSDFLYKNLNEISRKEEASSVHLADFPESLEDRIDMSLEERMQIAQTISSMVLSLRKKEKIKVRQPLEKIIVPVIKEGLQAKVEKVEDYILNEINVKSIEYLSDTSGIISKTIKPNFKTLGPKFGKYMKAISTVVSSFGEDEIATIEEQGAYNIEIDGKQLELDQEDFIISSDDIEGWLVASDKGLTVALDIHISEDLLAEGNAREFVNRVQNLRKDSNFEVTDKILIKLLINEDFIPALDKYKNYICAEILATDIEVVSSLDNGIAIEVNEIKLEVALIKK
ncbi:MAG: isoleucyl-tRNA synthetase [Chitinophagales bacterium]|jgi:isoleucyl-tRNA synthetase